MIVPFGNSMEFVSDPIGMHVLERSSINKIRVNILSDYKTLKNPFVIFATLVSVKPYSTSFPFTFVLRSMEESRDCLDKIS